MIVVKPDKTHTKLRIYFFENPEIIIGLINSVNGQLFVSSALMDVITKANFQNKFLWKPAELRTRTNFEWKTSNHINLERTINFLKKMAYKQELFIKILIE